MIPNIFISSTVEDLHHLRDSVREVIEEIGYNPVMSDHGDIGYLPRITAVDSCYVAVRACSMAILIIGKRYGSVVPAQTLSVTQNEFMTARENNIPTITLVDKEVLAMKRVYDANAGKALTFPTMDEPHATFKFVQAVKDSPLNNAILEFATVPDARNQIKKQFAHLFDDLLRNRFDSVKSEIKDVLSEIKTLRHEMKPQTSEDTKAYLTIMRALLDDRLQRFGALVELAFGSLEAGIGAIRASTNFDGFVKHSPTKIEMLENTS